MCVWEVVHTAHDNGVTWGSHSCALFSGSQTPMPSGKSGPVGHFPERAIPLFEPSNLGNSVRNQHGRRDKCNCMRGFKVGRDPQKCHFSSVWVERGKQSVSLLSAPMRFSLRSSTLSLYRFISWTLPHMEVNTRCAVGELCLLSREVLVYDLQLAVNDFCFRSVSSFSDCVSQVVLRMGFFQNRNYASFCAVGSSAQR